MRLARDGLTRFRIGGVTQFVAFLRAINVGGRTVKMERLRDLFTTAGYTNVKTFIASGNVLFDAKHRDAARLENKIESLLGEALGFEVATFVRSMTDLRAIAQHDPFVDSDRGKGANGELFVGFLKLPPSAERANEVESLSTDLDQFRFRGAELYWLCRTRVSDSPVSGALLERKLTAPLTIRNARTVRKIVAANPR